jgi:diguanylate cyclase (GGDEF)-like protein/PAS domain S-box-containing protein
MNQDDFFEPSNFSEDAISFLQKSLGKCFSYPRLFIDEEQNLSAEIGESTLILEALISLGHLLPLPFVVVALENSLILECNNHFSNLLDAQADTLKGQSFLCYCQAEDWENYLSFLHAQPFITSYKLKLTHPQNQSCWINFAAQCLVVDDQQIMLGICHVLTEQQQGKDDPETVKEALEIKALELAKALQQSENRLAKEIKERDSIQEALQDSEDKFQFLAESIPQQVWIAVVTGKLTYVNERILHYFNCAQEAVLGQGWQNYVHPEDLPRALRLWQSSLIKGNPYELTCRLRRGDGVYRWHLARAFPWKDETGKIINWFGTNTDIDDYQQTEIALRKSEERWQIALSVVQMGTWDWHQHSGELRWSKELERLYGMQPEEFDGRYETFLAKVHPRDRDSVLQAFEQALQQGQEYNIEFRVLWDDSSIHWLASKGTVLYDEEGRPNQMVGVDIDITARRQTEMSLRQAETKYRSIFENAVEGIFQTTPEGRFLSANPALATLYGYDSPEELIAGLDNIEHQLYVDPTHRQTLRQKLEENSGVVTFETRIRQRSGRVIWILEKVRGVRDSEGKILYYEGTVEDITERKRIKDQLHRQAYYDALTKLPNRAFFMENLQGIFQQARTSIKEILNSISQPESYFALLFLDLDRFKYINDSLGHLVGDKLLIAVARRLEKCVRPNDLIARLGGDEFTILLNSIQDPQQVIQIAERIQAKLSEPFKINGHPVFTGTSIGILLCNDHFCASSLPDQDELKLNAELTIYRTPEELLRDADTALYRAKALGKGRYEIFDQTMRQAVVQQLQLETDLHQAFVQKQFDVHYQPIVSLADGKLLGFEALLRWWHPTQGYVNPSKFIPIAEETGLIVSLGTWMLRRACEQLKTWQAQLSPQTNLVMHINLSSKQFVWHELVEQIDQVLAETGLMGNQLKLEITESNWFRNIHSQANCLSQLQKRQINLCLDDFGAGYSSLKCLQQYPMEALKIDKSYVSCLTYQDSNLEITRTIITLAHSLGMDAIAEGIESAEQLQILRQLGCDKGQGYFFASALDAKTAGILLDTLESPFICA